MIGRRFLFLTAIVATAACADLLGIQSATVDASFSDAPDDSSVGDSEADVKDGDFGINCGAEVCVNGSTYCCIGIGRKCVTNDTGTSGLGCPTLLKCDDRADCDSGVCCYTLNLADGGASAQSQCAPSCSGSTMCDPTTDSGCNCKPFTPLGFDASGYYSCQ